MQRQQRFIPLWTLFVLSALVISGCGGGGGSKSPDTKPDSFSFAAKNDQPSSEWVTSNSVTIKGISKAVDVTVQGGEYAIAGGTYTAQAGTISNGQTLSLRGMTSDGFGKTTTVTVKVGSATESFAITTAEQDIKPDDFSFTAKTGAAFGESVDSNTVTITGITGEVPVSVTGGYYAIDGGSAVGIGSNIKNGQTLTLSGKAASTFNTPVVVSVTVGEATEEFSITTIKQDIEPADFSFDSVSGVTSGTTVDSSTQTITEITGAVPISVVGGTYTIVGKGTATSNPGTIENGEQVFVTGQAPDGFDQSTTVSLTIGETTEKFVITSWEENTRPQAFSFVDKADAQLDTICTSGSVTISGINSAALVSVSEGAEYCIGQCSDSNAIFTSATGEVSNGESIVLRAQSAAVYSEDKSYTLTVGGFSATWTISTLGDTVNPTASIIFPTKVSLTDGTTLTVRGTAEDVSGIQEVTVSVFNDDTLFGTAVNAVAVDDSLTHWTATVTLNGEMDSTINTQTVNTVRVSVTDGVGNENVNAAEVLVTHQADYAGLDFPVGNAEDLTELQGATSLSLDVSKNRLLYMYDENVRAIDLNTSLRSLVATKSNAEFMSAEVVDGFIIVTDGSDKTLLSYDEGSLQFDVITGNATQSELPLNTPSALVFNSVDGLYYITDQVEDTIISVSKNGVRTLISGPAWPVNESVVIDGPKSLALDKTGSFVYMLSLNNSNLLQVDLATGDRELIDGVTFKKPQDLAIDTDAGVLYVSDYDLHKIFAIDLESKVATEVTNGESGDNQFPGPRSLVIDAAKGVLYFVTGKTFYPYSTILQLDLKTGARVVVNKSPIND